MDKQALFEIIRDLKELNAILRNIAYRALIYSDKLDQLLANTEGIKKRIEKDRTILRT